jgi:hypothetical protein
MAQPKNQPRSTSFQGFSSFLVPQATLGEDLSREKP